MRAYCSFLRRALRLGVLFSLVAYESGTVWCSAAMHAVWNMVMIGGVLHIGPEPDGYALLQLCAGLRFSAGNGR